MEGLESSEAVMRSVFFEPLESSVAACTFYANYLIKNYDYDTSMRIRILSIDFTDLAVFHTYAIGYAGLN